MVFFLKINRQNTQQVSRLHAAARCAASSESGLDSLALRLRSPQGAPLWGSRGQDVSLTSAEGRPEAVAPGRVGQLASASFQLPSKLQWKRTQQACEANRATAWTPRSPRRRELSDLQRVPSLPKCALRKREFNTVTFLFLVPTVAAALRTSRRGRAHFNELGFL